MARLTRMADAGAWRLLRAPDPGQRRVVLCYHSVSPQQSPLSLTPELFDAHLEWLERHGTVVPLEELVAGGSQASGTRVAITFDDGYADNHTHALPLLAARAHARDLLPHRRLPRARRRGHGAAGLDLGARRSSSSTRSTGRRCRSCAPRA